MQIDPSNISLCGQIKRPTVFKEAKRLGDSKLLGASIQHAQAPKTKFVVMVNVLEKKAKQHKKRRNQSESYHKRIQKKWDKKAQYDPEPKQLVASARLTAQLMEFDAAYYEQAEGRIKRAKT